MARPEITNTFSLGNIITLATILFAAAVGWGQLKTQMSAEQRFREDGLLRIEKSLAVANSSYDKLEMRIRSLEESYARSDERYSVLLSMMTELKVQVTALVDESRKE